MKLFKIIHTSILLSLLFVISSCGEDKVQKNGHVPKVKPEAVEEASVSLDPPFQANVDAGPAVAIEIPSAGLPPVPVAADPIAPPVFSFDGPYPPAGIATGFPEQPAPKWDHDCERNCNLGTATFSPADNSQWYELDTLAFPDTVTLSINRNQGYTRGEVSLTPTGIEVQESGTYWATFSAFVTNLDPSNQWFIPTFLVKNGVFIPGDISSQISSGASLPPANPQTIVNIQGNGILLDLNAGDDLSIVVTNAGGIEPQPITVISWLISVYKICD